MNLSVVLKFEGQVTAKKNSKQIAYTKNGRPFIRSGDAAKYQEELMAAAFYAGFLRLPFTTRQKFLNAPRYAVSIEVWNRDRRRHDLDNQSATIMDALVKAGILRDDNQNVVTKETLICRGVDKLHPRAEITIITIE